MRATKRVLIRSVHSFQTPSHRWYKGSQAKHFGFLRRFPAKEMQNCKSHQKIRFWSLNCSYYILGVVRGIYILCDLHCILHIVEVALELLSAELPVKVYIVNICITSILVHYFFPFLQAPTPRVCITNESTDHGRAHSPHVLDQLRSHQRGAFLLYTSFLTV